MTQEAVKPCWHMKNAVNQIAEGQSHGFWLRYARAHVKRCPQCQAALDALINYLETVKKSQTPPTSEFNFQKLNQAFDQVDQEKEAP